MQTIMIVEDDPDIRDGVRIALDCNRVWVDEQEADLTETEYKILKLLMQSPQRICTVWGKGYRFAAQDISVRFVKENGKAGPAFENAVLPGRHQPLRHREVDGATGPRQHRQAGRGLGHERLQAL